MNTRTELIQHLIDTHKLTSYLEIGVQNRANNFNKINIDNKECVDPDVNAKATYDCSSDHFFEKINKGDAKDHYDLIFIDGLHHAEQVEKDIINSMAVLNPGGFIVLHDCNPPNEMVQRVPRQTKEWYGDVWRAFVGFRMHHPEVESYCYGFDCGCGVITYTDKKIEPGFLINMSWEEFDKTRKKLLALC